jgi:hypothetical protein
MSSIFPAIGALSKALISIIAAQIDERERLQSRSTGVEIARPNKIKESLVAVLKDEIKKRSRGYCPDVKTSISGYRATAAGDPKGRNFPTLS